MTVIVGLDQSPLRCGWAVVENGAVRDFGVITRGPYKENIAVGVNQVLKTKSGFATDDASALYIAHKIAIWRSEGGQVFLEYPGASGPNIRTLCRLHYLCGSLTMALHLRGYDVRPVDVGEWTRMTGGRCLRREERVAIVQAAVPTYDPKTDRLGDAADAIGIACWGANVDLASLGAQR